MVRRDDLKQLKKSLKHKPELVSAKDNNGDTPLHVAARYDHGAAVTLLLANGADIQAKNNDGLTPLHVAAGLLACSGTSSVTELLIRGGADVNVKDHNGETPLHGAVESFNLDNARQLLANGADVGATDNNGRTALHNTKSKEIAELLLLNGADANPKDNKGNGPMHLVVGKQDPEMIAALMSGEDIIAVLLASGADANAKNNDGQTPLHVAARMGRRGVVQYSSLLTGGADINAQDNNGNTPLHLAVRGGHEYVAEILVKRGAKPTPEPFPTQSAVIREELSFEALVEELVSLCQAGYDWGLQNRFPTVQDYPQYSQVRKLGELIHAKADLEGMQQACHILRQRVVTREGGGQYLAEHSWSGIGGWRP